MSTSAETGRGRSLGKRDEGMKRINLEFSQSAMERLDSLKKVTEASSNAEVIRNALRLYAWVMEQKAVNKRFATISESNEVREVEFFF